VEHAAAVRWDWEEGTPIGMTFRLLYVSSLFFADSGSCSLRSLSSLQGMGPGMGGSGLGGGGMGGSGFNSMFG
jgi:hypothetical protein